MSASDPHQFIDVTKEFRAGHLDEIPHEETQRDLAVIRCYLEAEQRVAGIVRPDGEKRGSIAVARAVLKSVWEVPRMEFAARERAKGRNLQLGNKALLIPWSVEALDLYQTSGTTADLVQEHVLPVDEIWRELRRMYIEMDPEGWFGSAQAFLNYNYTLAVVTKEQAAMIDAAGFRKTGFHKAAFARYVAVMEAAAAGQIRPGIVNVPLDVERFVYPGFLPWSLSTDDSIQADPE